MGKRVINAEDGYAVVVHRSGMVRLEVVDDTEDGAVVRLTGEQAQRLAIALLTRHTGQVRLSLIVDDGPAIDDHTAAMNEFRYCARRALNEPGPGTNYALHMAAAECELLGIDPSRITPTGYDDPGVKAVPQ